jgi:hypothetical protein
MMLFVAKAAPCALRCRGAALPFDSVHFLRALWGKPATPHCLKLPKQRFTIQRSGHIFARSVG